MEGYFALYIRGVGLGTRPLAGITVEADAVRLSFAGGEECVAENPEGVTETDGGIEVEEADNVVWRGVPEELSREFRPGLTLHTWCG